MYRKIMNDLINWKNDPNKMPLIIKGARQIGKTNAIENFGMNNYKTYSEIFHTVCGKSELLLSTIEKIR